MNANTHYTFPEKVAHAVISLTAAAWGMEDPQLLRHCGDAYPTGGLSVGLAQAPDKKMQIQGTQPKPHRLPLESQATF